MLFHRSVTEFIRLFANHENDFNTLEKALVNTAKEPCLKPLEIYYPSPKDRNPLQVVVLLLLSVFSLCFRAYVDFHIEDFNKIGDRTPLLGNFKPSGKVI